MELLTAIGHIVGTLVALVIFAFVVLMLSNWEIERNRKAATEEMSLELGVSIEELNNEANQEKILQFSAAKFSPELLRNRLSDLCGTLQTGWGWLSSLLQAGLILCVVWYTITDDLSNAVYAWWAVGIGFTFWLLSAMFSLLCKLLTGRLPGQARQARKMLHVHLEKRHEERT